MAQRPEDIKPGFPGKEEGSGLEAQTSPHVKPTTLPLVDSVLVKVVRELEKRQKLLSSVELDVNGVAHCFDNISNTTTYLAAVCIDDKGDARLARLEKEENQLRFVLPGDRPSRIGFFVGYSSSKEASAVLRMGLYPGVPLTTQTVSDDKTAEVMYGLGGLKPNETDEQKWAKQIGLYTDLGFKERQSRGMFNRSHRADPTSDRWQQSPLIVLPDEMLDTVRHYDPKDVKKDEFQVQFYGKKPVKSEISDIDEVRESLRPAPLTLGMKGLGIGFGESKGRTAQTSNTNVDSLVGAFNIIVTPQQ